MLARIAFVLMAVLCCSLCAPRATVAQGGIMIDTRGVIKKAKKNRTISRKSLQAAAKKQLSAEINLASELRFVSLTRLEAECEKRLQAGQALPPEIRFLAGLQRIDYVVVLKETKEVLIGGPADGFAASTNGVMVGVTSGRPVLRLDDLVQAFQAWNTHIKCSFDPRPEKLADVQRYLQSVGDAPSISVARKRYKEMTKILGNQVVSVAGVDPKSHFARTLVEADYKLKRIGAGLERSKVKGMSSYLDLKTAGTNSMRRWWFAPSYGTLEHSEDRSVWKLSGQRVQLKSEDELVSDNGQRRGVGQRHASTATFQRLFTQKYQELADRFEVLARLQNVFDLAIATALIRQEQLDARVGWKLSAFARPGRIPVKVFNVPREVPSACNSRTAGRYLVVGVVCGGVSCKPIEQIRTMKRTISPRVFSTGVTAAKSRSSNWWWDADQ